MTFAKYLLPILLLSSSLPAQQLSHPVMESWDDAFSAPRPFITAVDTLRVLAVMVQFQIDNDSRTNGNGQFDLSLPATTGLDSPPRNRQYFLDHLTFLSNYYRRASKGKVIVQATLVDSVFTLGSQMARYSPPKSGPNTVVGDLARDSWLKVDSSGRISDFSTYDCFIVFHAGVGRDVDVAGTVGFDPTPLDIPSLYLGLNAFKEFYGSNYQGIPVRNGFNITNTIIIPETETREIPATPANVVLRLGINGLLCASVGNFLGLPDLFDTNTGRSGIGRFGLMDGQAIFSFAGAFPPEPSAWEKYWLGWIQPITIQSGDHTLGFPATSIADTVYRVPISASEYFLVENRNRDALRNGQRITSSYNGVIRQQSFARDTAGFNAFDLSLIGGNITDVEDLDWSLPGGVNNAGTFYDGGILIWHIDETVIAQGLAVNGVNANPSRRGVDVEEADGSQDIGQQYGQLEPGSGSEEGTVLDFWYLDNESPVNTDEFSSRSFPNSASNNGANSLITIKGFSARGPRMTAKVIVGDNVSLMTGFPKSIPNKLQPLSLTIADLGAATGPSIFVTTGRESSDKPQLGSTTPFPSRIYAWKSDGDGLLRSDGLFAEAGASTSAFLGAVAVRDLNSDGVSEVVAGETLQNTSIIHAYSAQPRPVDSLAATAFTWTVDQVLSTTPFIGDSTIALGGAKGKSFFLRFDGAGIDSLQRFPDSSTILGITKVRGSNTALLTTENGTLTVIIPRAAMQPSTTVNLGKQIAGSAIGGRVGNEDRVAVATTDGFLYLLSVSLATLPGFPVNVGARISRSPILADIDGDGIRDIVVFAGNKIYAYNHSGASLDYFPKQVFSSTSIASNPVVADVDGDGDVDIVAVTEDGVVVAYDRSGTIASGFPLQAGTGNQSVAAFTYTPPAGQVSRIGLVVASSNDGSVSGWWTGTVGPVQQPVRGSTWLQHLHDAQHTGLAEEATGGTPIGSTFFPKERAYNWPNPAYEGKTFIRYFVGEAAAVRIKIFDLAGDLVAELNGPGVAGVDNEVEWNVSDVQSGIYLARIEASGSGKSETAVVKVAVVK